MFSENKVGTHDQNMGHSVHTQRSFLYRAINIFNKLPKNLTLSPSSKIFKFWCKKFNLNNKIKIPEREYNSKPRETYAIDDLEIQQCENNYNF